MLLEILTQGSCSNGSGTWSYSIEYVDRKSRRELIHSDRGEAFGTTDIQMKLMAILKALSYIRSMDPVEQIIIKSDCPFCIKCITKEFDCTRDDAFKRDKVTRGFVQYLQEIQWKMSGLDVQFESVH
jgi:ribonuclease HI